MVDGTLGLLPAIALPLIAATAWGVWVAPRAPRRLAVPRRTMLEVVLFATAALLLWAAGAASLAVLLIGLYVIDAAVVHSTGAELSASR